MSKFNAKAAHVETLQHQILVSRQGMNEALDRGDFRKAEQFLDQLTSFKKMLEACA